MRKLIKPSLVVLLCVVLWGFAPTSQARERAIPAESDAGLTETEPQVLTLEIRAGEQAATVRILEGRRAKLTHGETGEVLLVTAIRQPSGELALEIVEGGLDRDPVAQRLLQVLPLQQGSQQVIESPQRQRLQVELVANRPGQLKATSKLITLDDTETEKLAPRQCCVTCDGWKFCACGVDTSCGSCCVGWCCDFM